MRSKYTIEIAAPLESVYRWIDEPDRVTQWLPHVVSYERLGETEDKVGTRIRQIWDDNGEKTELKGYITRYHKPFELGLELSGNSFRVKVDYVLRDVGGRTELTQKTRFRYLGLLRFIDLFLSRFVRKSYQSDLSRNFSRLSQLCEAEG